MSPTSLTQKTMSTIYRSSTLTLGACALALLAGCAGGDAGEAPQQDTVATATAEAPAGDAPRVLIVGGGNSHDFDTWFHQADSTTLAGAGAEVAYTDDPAAVLTGLRDVDVLYLTNNQPLPDTALRERILALPAEGTGLVIGHAGAWYNWEDWPEYNRSLVGGGARGHRAYGDFTVEVTQPDHPIMEGVPTSFTLEDELYRFERDEQATEITVLATATEEETGTTYPIVWTVDVPEGRVVVNTLGHDGASHDHPAYQQILRNSLQWAAGGGS